jgi:hypothetical protein
MSERMERIADRYRKRWAPAVREHLRRERSR